MNINYVRVGDIGTNCYIVCNEKNGQSAVIDPGADAPRILAAVEESGCMPQKILLTHGHFDHIGAVRELTERFHCRLAVPEAERAFLNDPHRNLQSSMTDGEFVPLKPDILFRDGDIVEAAGLQFSVISTPGHTPGSCCLLCGNILFSGDTLFAGGVGRTDMPGGDAASLQASLRRLAALPGNFHVLPGHGCFSTLDDERRGNPYLAGKEDA